MADLNKIANVAEWPISRTGGDGASFLGLCNYYRELIPHFADITKILYEAVQNEQLDWTEPMEEALRRLKQALTFDRVVKIVQPNAQLILETNASLSAIGAALKQVNADDGKEYPVGFLNKALIGPARRYSVYEREMLAVVKACQHYRVILIGRHFTVRADHKALRSILK